MAHKNHRTPRAARPASLHQAVSERRRALGRNTATLAADAGVSVRTVQRLERGKPVSADTILRIERALKLTAGTLVPGWNTGGSLGSNAIGPRLREQRRKLDLTLESAVQGTGLSIATLSRLERGLLGEVHYTDPTINSALIRNLDFWGQERFEEWATEYKLVRERRPR